MALMQLIKRLGKTATQNRDDYWTYQREIGNYFLNEYLHEIDHNNTILDIGCGEGGVLSVFLERGFHCYGLELNVQRVAYAKEQYGDKIIFFHDNIEDFKCAQPFDIIIMADVIEHIANKRKALAVIKDCLKPNGQALITFPPYRSAFGGHQQTLRSFLKYIPYWHLFPRKLYIQLYKWFEKDLLASRLEIYENGITIEQFEKLIQAVGLNIVKRIDYFIRPRQALRFGLSVRENRLPFFREFITTGVTYLLEPNPT